MSSPLLLQVTIVDSFLVPQSYVWSPIFASFVIYIVWLVRMRFPRDLYTLNAN